MMFTEFTALCTRHGIIAPGHADYKNYIEPLYIEIPSINDKEDMISLYKILKMKRLKILARKLWENPLRINDLIDTLHYFGQSPIAGLLVFGTIAEVDPNAIDILQKRYPQLRDARYITMNNGQMVVEMKEAIK